LTGTIILELLTFFCFLIHFGAYASDGVGFPFMQDFGERNLYISLLHSFWFLTLFFFWLIVVYFTRNQSRYAALILLTVLDMVAMIMFMVLLVLLSKGWGVSGLPLTHGLALVAGCTAFLILYFVLFLWQQFGICCAFFFSPSRHCGCVISTF
jgi:hypothetical protein